MFPVSLEATFPESQRSGWPSRTAVEATRISYAVWPAADEPPGPSGDRLQLRLGVVSPSPIGSVSVSTRSEVAVSADRAGFPCGAPG